MAANENSGAPAQVEIALRRPIYLGVGQWLAARAWRPQAPPLLMLLGCTMLASCHEGPLDPQGPVGQAERVGRKLQELPHDLGRQFGVNDGELEMEAVVARDFADDLDHPRKTGI